MKVSFFETVRYRAAARRCRPSGRCRRAPTIRDAGAAGLPGHDRAARVRRGARLRLGQRLRAPLLAAHPDPVADRLGGVHRRPPQADHDRAARPDRPPQQSGARGRGAGDARHDGAGAPGRRAAARHGQRGHDLRPQPAGGARAHRRGHGADPQGVDGAAAVRLAGPPLPVPHGLDLAAPAAAAASADLRARDEPRVVRVRRAPPPRLRRVLRPVRGDGQGHALLPRAVRAPRLAAGARADHLSGEHAAGRDRRRGPGRCCARSRTRRRSRMRAGRARRRDDARLPQHRGRGAGAGRERRAADDVRRQPRHGRRAGPALSRGGRRRRPRPVACTRRAPATSSRSCARSSCSARRCCRASARSEGAQPWRRRVPRGLRRGRRLPDPLHGGRAGRSAGAPARRRRAAPHAARTTSWLATSGWWRSRCPGSDRRRNTRTELAESRDPRDGSASTPSTSWARRSARRRGWRSRAGALPRRRRPRAAPCVLESRAATRIRAPDDRRSRHVERAARPRRSRDADRWCCLGRRSCFRDRRRHRAGDGARLQGV